MSALRLVLIAQQRIAFRQLADFHAAVGTARKQTTASVDVELRDTLTDVLEEAAAGVLRR